MTSLGIIYEGTSEDNLSQNDRLFNQGLKTCLRSRIPFVKDDFKIQKIISNLQLKNKETNTFQEIYV